MKVRYRLTHAVSSALAGDGGCGFPETANATSTRLSLRPGLTVEVGTDMGTTSQLVFVFVALFFLSSLRRQRESRSRRLLRRLITRGSLAGANPVLKETSLHRTAGQLERNGKMFARIFKVPPTNLKLTERGVVERIIGQTF